MPLSKTQPTWTPVLRLRGPGSADETIASLRAYHSGKALSLFNSIFLQA